MCHPAYLNLAIEYALSLDIPDHLIPLAIADQAKLLGLIDCDSEFVDDWALGPESFNPLR